MQTQQQVIANVAANVARILEERGISQADLARMAGESEMNISRVVRGKNEPGAALLSHVAEALQVSVDYLLTPHPSAPQKKTRRSA